MERFWNVFVTCKPHGFPEKVEVQFVIDAHAVNAEEPADINDAVSDVIQHLNPNIAWYAVQIDPIKLEASK